MDSERPNSNPRSDEEQTSVEHWEARVDQLQNLVCLLLVKNEKMRMELTAAKVGCSPVQGRLS
jgi:hypothetical protein